MVRLAWAIPLLLAALVVAPASATPWLQWQHDGAGTSATPDPGPPGPTVGLFVPLPPPLFYRQVLVKDEAAFVLTSEGIFRVDLASAAVTNIFPLPAGSTQFETFAGDAERLYVTLPDGLQALSHDGTPLWKAPFPPMTRLPRETACRPPHVSEGVIYLACSAFEGEAKLPPPLGFDPTEVGDRAEYYAAIPTTGGSFLFARAVGEQDPRRGPQSFAGHIARLGGVLVTTSATFARPEAPLVYEGRHPMTGEVLWSVDRNATRRASADSLPEGNARPTEGLGSLSAAFPVGNADIVFLLQQDLQAVDVENGRSLWNVPVPLSPRHMVFRAMQGDTLVLTSDRSLGVLDAGARSFRTLAELRPGEAFGPVALAGSNILALRRTETSAAGDPTSTSAVPASYAYALDATTIEGEARWSLPLGTLPNWLSGNTEFPVVGEAAFFHEREGLKVVGRVPGAIRLAATANDAYPKVGAPVAIDASGTLPGIQAAATEFRVDWGDGTVTPWSQTPLFEHVYPSAGEWRATVHARNVAGQTALTTVPVFVGGIAPATPGLLDKAFSAEHQELTFFLLGLALTAVGGVFGILRPRRRRARTRALLAEVDEVQAKTRDDPLACEAALLAHLRRTRARLLSGELDEDQANAVALHVQELVHAARMRVVASRYAAIPPSVLGLVRAALADGVVDRVEQAHILAALEQDATIGEPERVRVRALLASWASHDAEDRGAQPP